MNKSMKDFADEIKNLESRIGDYEIAHEIIYLSRIQKISKRLLLNRYKDIVTLFNTLGFKSQEVVDYIKRNKKILKMDSSTIFENYRIISSLFIRNKKTKSALKQYISSSYNGKSILTTPNGNILKMINLITKIFKANGKTLEEAYKYLCDNINILMENSDSLIAKLSVLSAEGLDNKLIFEEPMYIYCDVDSVSLNNSIKCLKAENKELSLDSIFSHAFCVMDNEYEIIHSLTNEDLSKSTYDYCSKLNKKCL